MSTRATVLAAFLVRAVGCFTAPNETRTSLVVVADAGSDTTGSGSSSGGSSGSSGSSGTTGSIAVSCEGAADCAAGQACLAPTTGCGACETPASACIGDIQCPGAVCDRDRNPCDCGLNESLSGALHRFAQSLFAGLDLPARRPLPTQGLQHRRRLPRRAGVLLVRVSRGRRAELACQRGTCNVDSDCRAGNACIAGQCQSNVCVDLADGG